MFVCAGDSEQFDFAIPIGIGMVDAAINLTQLCLKEAPESIIFVGTAGSYGGKAIFDIVESRTASNVENGFYDDKTYTPIDNMVSSAENVSRETIINTSNYITVDSHSSQQYIESGIDLENMEFFSVLKVASKFGIPAKGIFIVTNYCNADSHDEFVRNHERAKKYLTQYIRTQHA